MVRTMRGGVEPLLAKVITIAGDVIESDLALSKNDRQYITENTDIIVHAAATIRYNNKV